MTDNPRPRRSAANREEDLVLYVGGADVRQITKSEWEGAGVENQDTVVFNKENNWRVPADELTGDALQLLLDGHKREFNKNQLEVPPPAPNGE
jgi:hypothetical protein